MKANEKCEQPARLLRDIFEHQNIWQNNASGDFDLFLIRGRMIATFALVDLAVSSQVGDNRKVPAATFNFAGKRYSLLVSI